MKNLTGHKCRQTGSRTYMPGLEHRRPNHCTSAAKNPTRKIKEGGEHDISRRYM
jgi:hypothetical protein